MTTLAASDPLVPTVAGSISRTILSGARLPERVFCSSYSVYSWIEYDIVLDDPFFRFVQKLSRACGEEAFYVQCASPDPQINFGHSGVAVFSPVDDVVAYDAFMDAPAPGTTSICVRNVGDLLAYAGPSSAWAIVADRFAELAVVGHSGGRYPWPDSNLPFVSFEAALRIAAGSYRGKLPDEIAESYIRNYAA